jgi:hypothetical protein
MSAHREVFENTISNEDQYQAIILNQIENGDLAEIIAEIKICYSLNLTTEQAVKIINK